MRPFESALPSTLHFADLLYAKREGVATITINRPSQCNAYSITALKELAVAIRDASFDDAIGVIVITGEGSLSFCSGWDVKECHELYATRPRDFWKYLGLFTAGIESILGAGKPVIARLNGATVGGGNETQLACDLAVMAEHTWIGQTETHVGTVAAGGATQWLPLHVGDRRAREMLMLNERISAHQALDWGLVNRVVPSVTKDGAYIEGATPHQIECAQAGKDGYAIDLEWLDDEVAHLAKRLLEQFPECQRYTKQSTNFWKDFAWHQTIGHAREWLAVHSGGLERWEGSRAFLEKRPVRVAELRARAAEEGSSDTRWGNCANDCPVCGAEGLPREFCFCGVCGAPMVGANATVSP